MKVFKIFFCIIFLSSLATNAFAIEPPFGSETISSDYGPRLYYLNGVVTRDFHFAIDYNPETGNSDEGEPIPAVETGIVDDIYRFRDAWIISVLSGTNMWNYVHIFRNEVPTYGNNIVSRNFELGVMNNNGRDIYFIIRNAYGNYPTKAFAKEAGLQVPGRPGLLTEITVVNREPIAPIGISGIGTGAHLHLSVRTSPGAKVFNPLYLLDHDASNFQITLRNPLENAVLISTDLLTNFSIIVRINANNGKDLNRVTLWLDTKQLGSPTFSFSGLPTETSEILTNPSNNNTVSGIDPVIETYEDDFVFITDFSQLTEGEHYITIRVTDIEGNNNDTVHKFSPLIENFIVA